MNVSRLIHTTVKGTDKIFTTDNYPSLLKQIATAPGIDYNPANLSVIQTTAIPDFEEETGRMFTRSDKVTVSFTTQELINALTDQEKAALLQRLAQQLNLSNRIIRLQSVNLELTQPLPEVRL